MSSLDEHLPTENYRWKAIPELISENWKESGVVSFFFVGIFQID